MLSFVFCSPYFLLLLSLYLSSFLGFYYSRFYWCNFLIVWITFSKIEMNEIMSFHHSKPFSAYFYANLSIWWLFTSRKSRISFNANSYHLAEAVWWPLDSCRAAQMICTSAGKYYFQRRGVDNAEIWVGRRGFCGSGRWKIRWPYQIFVDTVEMWASRGGFCGTERYKFRWSYQITSKLPSFATPAEYCPI